MTELCRDFGVSRKTDHKWVAHHAEGGMKASCNFPWIMVAGWFWF